MPGGGFEQPRRELSICIGIFHVSSGGYDRGHVQRLGQLVFLPSALSAPNEARDLLGVKPGANRFENAPAKVPVFSMV
jgi:hypothetical protein